VVTNATIFGGRVCGCGTSLAVRPLGSDHDPNPNPTDDPRVRRRSVGSASQATVCLELFDECKVGHVQSGGRLRVLSPRAHPGQLPPPAYTLATPRPPFDAVRRQTAKGASRGLLKSVAAQRLNLYRRRRLQMGGSRSAPWPTRRPRRRRPRRGRKCSTRQARWWLWAKCGATRCSTSWSKPSRGGRPCRPASAQLLSTPAGRRPRLGRAGDTNEGEAVSRCTSDPTSATRPAAQGRATSGSKSSWRWWGCLTLMW
jgi:hypothetical protein